MCCVSGLPLLLVQEKAAEVFAKLSEYEELSFMGNDYIYIRYTPRFFHSETFVFGETALLVFQEVHC